MKNGILSIRMKKYKYTKQKIMPILLYAAETIVLSQRKEERLQIVVRKIIRIILGVKIIEENRYQITMIIEIKK